MKKRKKFLIGILTVLVITVSTITGCLGGEREIIEEITLVKDEEHQISGTDYSIILIGTVPPAFHRPESATIEIYRNSERVDREIIDCESDLKVDGIIEIDLKVVGQDSAEVEIYRIKS